MRRILFFSLVFWALSVRGETGRGLIDYSSLKNPIYSYRDWSIKDSCMAEKDGTFYIFFSAFFQEGGRFRCHISGVKTRDFKNFSEPMFIWGGRELGYEGMCSPNISKIGDTYYLTYNSWGDTKGRPNQLFYARSKDLENWEKDFPIATNLTAGKRSIDIAIAYWNDRYYLVWKEFQTPMMAVGDTLGPEGWKSLGEVPGGWFENGQFIQIDGKWYVLVTDQDHLPALRAVRGEGKTDEDWVNLGGFQRLNVPEEEFNRRTRANCAFLFDYRDRDGYFYLLFSGRNKGLDKHGDRFYKLGISRSKDLVIWEKPGR